MHDPDEVVVYATQRVPQHSLCTCRQKHPPHLRKGQQKQRQKRLRPPVFLIALRNGVNRFTMQRQTIRCVASVAAPRGMQSRRSVCHQKPDELPPSHECHKEWTLLKRQRLLSPTPKRDTVHCVLRQVCQRHRRQGRPRGLCTVSNIPGQASQAWTIPESHQQMAEGNDVCEIGESKASLMQVRPQRRKLQQAPRGTQQTAPQAPTAYEATCITDIMQSRTSRNSAVYTERAENGILDAQDIALAPTTLSRTRTANANALCFEPVNVIRWIWLRLERLLDRDEEWETCRGLNSDGWKTMLSDFVAQYCRLKRIFFCEGGRAVPPALFFESKGSRNVEIEIPEGGRNPESLAGSHDIHYSGERQSSCLERGDPASLIALVFAAFEEAANGEEKQSICGSKQAVQSDAARDAAVAMLTQQLQQVLNGGADSVFILRAAAALPRSAFRRGNCGIAEQVETLQFLGQNENALLLRFLTRRQRPEATTVSEEEDDTRATSSQHQQPLPSRKTRFFQQSKDLCSQRDPHLQKKLCCLNRRKLLFHDELSLLQRATAVSPTNTWGLRPLLDTFGQPPPLEGRQVSKISRTWEAPCTGRAQVSPDDGDREDEAFTAAVECGAAVAVYLALAEKGLTQSSIAALLPFKQWPPSIPSQQETTEEKTWGPWKRLAWTFHTFREASKKTPANQRHAVHASSVAHAAEERPSIVTKCFSPPRYALVAASAKRDGRDKSAAEATAALASTPPQARSSVSAGNARRRPPASLVSSQAASVDGRFVEDYVEKVGREGTGALWGPPLKTAADFAAPERRAQAISAASNRARASKSESPVTLTRMPTQSTHPARLSLHRQTPSRQRNSSRRNDHHHSSPPAADFALPRSGWAPFDIRRRALVCRLCGNTILPTWERTSIEEHVLHLLRSHCKLYRLWVLLVDVKHLSQSMRRLFVRIINSAIQRQQSRQRPDRALGDRDETKEAVASASTEKVCTRRRLSAPHTRDQRLKRSGKYETPSGTRSFAERIQIEALQRSAYPVSGKTLARSLLQVGRALLSQHAAAWCLQQLLQRLSHQVNNEDGFNKNPFEKTANIDRLCADMEAAKPFSTVGVFPSLWTVQQDNSLSLMISFGKQLLPDFELTPCCFPDNRQQSQETHHVMSRQHVICWMPRDVFEQLDPSGISASHVLLHALLQARVANAHGLSRAGAVPPLSSVLLNSMSISSRSQITLLQPHRRSPHIFDARSRRRGAGDRDGTPGLLLQAASLCNEEFEVLSSPCRWSGREPEGSRLLMGSSRIPYFGSQSRSSSKTMVASPLTANLRSITPRNDAPRVVDEATKVTEKIVSSSFTQDVPTARVSTAVSTAASDGPTSLLFPPVSSSMDPEQLTFHDEEALLQLKKSFSSAAVADGGQSTRDYLLQYVLALTSSGFLLPCVSCSTVFKYHRSRCYTPASSKFDELAIKAFVASDSCFATDTAGHTTPVESALQSLAENVCSEVSALPRRATRDLCSTPLAATNCDLSQRDAGGTAGSCSQHLAVSGRSQKTRRGTGGSVSASAAWTEFPVKRCSRTTPLLTTLDTASTSIGSSLNSRQISITAGRIQRKQSAVKCKDADAAGSRSYTLDNKQSFPAPISCHVSYACFRDLTKSSFSSKNLEVRADIQKKFVQHWSGKSRASFLYGQGEGNGKYVSAKKPETSMPAQPTLPSFSTVRSALQRVKKSSDTSDDVQQSVSMQCVLSGRYEQRDTSARKRKYCSRDFSTLPRPCTREATARWPDSTSPDPERLFHLTDDDQAKALTLQASSAQVRQLWPSSTTDAADPSLNRLRTKKDREHVIDDIEVECSACQDWSFPLHQLTRYSWYEAFSLVPQLLRSHSCGIEGLQRHHTRPTQKTCYPRSFCTATRRSCSPRVRQPAEEKSLEEELIALSAVNPSDASEVLLQQFHLVALQPSVAVPWSEGHLYEMRMDDASVGGLDFATQERGSEGVRVCEVALASATSGVGCGDGAAFQCPVSGGACRFESMLQPASFCSASFHVAYTASPSAEAYAETRPCRFDSRAPASPSKQSCTSPSDQEGHGAGLSYHKVTDQPDETRHRVRGSHVRAVNVADSCSAGKAAGGDTNLNTVIPSPRRGSVPSTSCTVRGSSRRLFSETVRRKRKYPFAATGGAPSGPEEVADACRYDHEEDSELRGCTPLCFLSFLCSYRSNQSHPCLFEMPCRGSSATAGTVLPACGCPLQPAQAAVVATVLYGQYGSLCAELATLLLTGWHFTGSQTTVPKDLRQEGRKEGEQSCESLCFAEPCDAPCQPGMGSAPHIRPQGMTEYSTEVSKTRTLLLRLVCHQLQCPLATEIMFRPDFATLLLTRASCKDCRRLVVPLLCVTQLQTWLRIGTNYLVKTDGFTPESAAALAACAALDNSLHNYRLFHSSIPRRLRNRTVIETRTPRALIRLMRHLAAMVLSNILSVFYKFVEAKTEKCLLYRRRAGTREVKEVKGERNGTQSNKTHESPPTTPVTSRSPDRVRRGCSTNRSTCTDSRAGTDAAPLFAVLKKVCRRSDTEKPILTSPSLSPFQQKFCKKKKRSSADYRSRAGDLKARWSGKSISQQALLTEGIEGSAKHFSLYPVTVLPEATSGVCVRAEGNGRNGFMSEQTNEKVTKLPHCALANVEVPICPSARQECVDFGGFVRLCDDVKTGLHVQVTPFTTYLRRGAPLYIRHQLQRSGIRQSVLVDSFVVQGLAKDDIECSFKARGGNPVPPHSGTTRPVDYSKCCVQMQEPTASGGAGGGTPSFAPAASDGPHAHENPLPLVKQTNQRFSARRCPSCKSRAIQGNNPKAPRDRLPTAAIETVISCTHSKQLMQTPVEMTSQEDLDSISRMSKKTARGEDLPGCSVLKPNGTPSTGTGSVRRTELVQNSRIDLFAWNLLLENDIHISLPPTTLLSDMNTDGQTMDSEGPLPVCCIVPRRSGPQCDNARNGESLFCYKRTTWSSFKSKGKITGHDVNLVNRKDGSLFQAWDECYDEDEPSFRKNRQSESVSLEVKRRSAEIPHAPQPDALLPTDGSSHNRLLAAYWQGAPSSSLVPATLRMQEVNVSPFHGLVISEAALLPENARLQLRRNELFFVVDQRERQASMTALLEITALRLGVKIPSFIAHTKLLKLQRSRVHGWGVFAGEPICRDEFIVEYSSSVISDAVANFREWQYMQSLGGKTYFFKLKNSCVVDATSSGGLTRFINHSCTPNCRTQDICNDGADDAGAHCHLGLYALRDISVGEELFYDYRQVGYMAPAAYHRGVRLLHEVSVQLAGMGRCSTGQRHCDMFRCVRFQFVC